MCPSVRRVGDPEFQTVDGGDIPKDQYVEMHTEKNPRIVCENKKQKARSEHTVLQWPDKEVLCSDYRIRQVDCWHLIDFVKIDALLGSSANAFMDVTSHQNLQLKLSK